MALLKIIESLLRTAQFTSTAIILGLCGALLEQQYRGGTPTRLNYSMFCGALAALSLFYLIPAVFINTIRHPISILVLDGLNTIFLLCAGIALASELHGRGCNDWGFLRHNGITNGGGLGAPWRQRCREANALTAFEWFASAAFFLSAIVVAWDTKKSCDVRTLHRGRPDMRSVGV